MYPSLKVSQWSPSDWLSEETVRESYEYFCDLRNVITGFCSVFGVFRDTEYTHMARKSIHDYFNVINKTTEQRAEEAEGT